MERRQSPSALLGHSFKLLFSNYALFLPYIVSIAAGTALLFFPFFQMLVKGQVVLSPQFFLMVMVLVIVSIALSLIVYGWVFAAIQPVVIGKKLNILAEFRAGLSMAWVIFLQMLLIILAAIAVVVVIFVIALGIGASYILSAGLGIALTVLGVLALILFSLWFFGYMMHVGAVLIVERAGPVSSLKTAWKHMMANPTVSLKMLLLSFLLLVLSYIPTAILAIVFQGNPSFMFEHMATYMTISMVFSIPMIIVMTALLIFYSLDYRNALAGAPESGRQGIEKKSTAKKKGKTQ